MRRCPAARSVRDRFLVVAHAVHEDRALSLEVAGQEDVRADGAETEGGHRRAHRPNLPQQLGAERLDVVVDGRIDIDGGHVDEVERFEHRRQRATA